MNAQRGPGRPVCAVRSSPYGGGFGARAAAGLARDSAHPPGLWSSPSLRHVELHLLPLLESALDLVRVNEDVASLVGRDEPECADVVEPRHRPVRHHDLLFRSSPRTSHALCGSRVTGSAATRPRRTTLPPRTLLVHFRGSWRPTPTKLVRTSAASAPEQGAPRPAPVARSRGTRRGLHRWPPSAPPPWVGW